MRMKSFSARDAAKNFGELLDAADLEPVMIRRYARPRAAVIGWRLFEEYKKAYDKAFDERQVRLLELRLDALLAGKLGANERIAKLAARLGGGDATVSDPAPGESARGD